VAANPQLDNPLLASYGFAALVAGIGYLAGGGLSSYGFAGEIGR